MECSFPRNESSTGANVPRNESSWNVRSQRTKVPQERKLQGANECSTERKFHGSESSLLSLLTFRSRELKCRGMKRPGFGESRPFHLNFHQNFRSWELSFLRTITPGNFRSRNENEWELSFHRIFSLPSTFAPQRTFAPVLTLFPGSI